MNAKRILKEARPLFWPWCVVVLAAGVVPLLPTPYSFEWVSAAGLFLGVPLLAALPLGNEFEYRTLSLLLSQPAGRMEIWREKLSVTGVAVVSAVLIFVLAWGTRFPHSSRSLVLAGAVIAAVTLSATFWTLAAGSTLGGVVLNTAACLFIILSLSLMLWFQSWAVRSRFFAPAVTFVFLGYAGIMLWLGGRTLARFQAVGGASSDDLLLAGPRVLPGAFPGWLRCRPTGAVLNLFRKEVRLLRPVWLLTLLAAVGWTCVTVVWLLHHRGATTSFSTAVVSVGVICTLMIAVPAGSLSLGEERTAGTHAWHLTLPVPPFLQWGVKLLMALVAGAVGAWLLPALIGGRCLFTSSHVWGDRHFGINLLVGVLLLTFAAFWCACAVEGTIAAVLWMVPVSIVVGLATYLSGKAADRFLDFFSSWAYSPIRNLRLDWWVTSALDRHLMTLLPLYTSEFEAVLLGGPVVILALVQSYRMFRTPQREGGRSLVGNLMPLALLLFLCGFLVTVFETLPWVVGNQVPMLVGVTDHAIQRELPAAAQRGAKPPLRLTLDDVAKACEIPLAETTRGWLTGARITVSPDKAHPGGFYCQENQTGYGIPNSCAFSVTIQLADGTELIESYDPLLTGRPGSLGRGHLSVYVRWPGATGEESLWDR